MSECPVANQRKVRPRSRRRSRPTGRNGEDSAAGASAESALLASVLVLNRLYMAIHVVHVRRAFGLLFRDLAEVIHLENDPHNGTTYANYDFRTWREISEFRANSKQPEEDWVRAVNFEIQAPRVIRLHTFDRIPKQQVRLSRRAVLARDSHLCQYCGREFPNHKLSLDHVTPRSHGGTTTWENVVCACLRCNAKKGGRTPKQAHMKLIAWPTKPRRNPLFLLKLANPKYASWRIWLDGAH